MKTIIRNARVLTMLPGVPPASLGSAAACGTTTSIINPGPLRGTLANELGVIASADVTVENGFVTAITRANQTSPASPPNDSSERPEGPSAHCRGWSEPPSEGASATPGAPAESDQPRRGETPNLAHQDTTEINAAGRVLMPGFIDAHTHALWAGDRLDEWDMKRRGVPYLDILKSGGGIMSTVRAVRAATEETLAASLAPRLRSMLREGTTTVEIKSGYGLTTADELKMLRGIRRHQGIEASRHQIGSGTPLPTVISTALIAHALDPGQPDFIERTIHETLDAVHAAHPGIAIDAYCESGAWSLADCIRLFERAKSLSHPFRVHTDQFNDLGMTRWAVDHGAISVDHLEASSPETLRHVAKSNTFGVMLPCAGFHTDARYADGRRFIDEGGAMVIATNVNPGSAPCASMPMAIALAVRYLKITPAEAIAACTRNAACLLGLHDRGVIAPGARADLILLRHTDERMLAYEFGGNPVDAVACGGGVVSSTRS